jgi:hypothetical protein
MNSGLPNPQPSQLSPTSPHPGGTTFNFKHPILCFVAPNTRPNTSQQERKGVSVKTIGGEFVIYGRGSSLRPTEICCTWSATRRPLLSYNLPPTIKGTLNLASSAWRQVLRSARCRRPTWSPRRQELAERSQLHPTTTTTIQPTSFTEIKTDGAAS